MRTVAARVGGASEVPRCGHKENYLPQLGMYQEPLRSHILVPEILESLRQARPQSAARQLPGAASLLRDIQLSPYVGRIFPRDNSTSASPSSHRIGSAANRCRRGSSRPRSVANTSMSPLSECGLVFERLASITVPKIDEMPQARLAIPRGSLSGAAQKQCPGRLESARAAATRT
jgi:hypothetical protein